MTISDILCVMGEAGVRFTRESLPKVFNYVSRMVEDHRCITISDHMGEKVGVIFFSVCEDWEPHYRRDKWEYVPHNPGGHILYIELAASSVWNKHLRRDFEDGLLQKYPNLQVGVWHRWGRRCDRRVIAKRRTYVSDTHSNK